MEKYIAEFSASIKEQSLTYRWTTANNTGKVCLCTAGSNIYYLQRQNNYSKLILPRFFALTTGALQVHL